MAAQDPSFAEMAQKAEQDLHNLEEEDKALAAFEAELHIAELRVEAAEARYNVATRQVASELAKPLYEEEKVGASAAQETPFAHDDTADSAEKGATEKHHKGSKNAGALSDKAVSSSRWVAKRAQETRVRDATKRARDRLRRAQRDRRAEYEAGGESVEADAGEAKPAAAAPKAKEPAKLRELTSADTPVAAEGALSIADRLNRIKENSDADKQGALAKTVTGGRDNYYTFDPSDVVADLRERNLLDAATATELIAIIEAAAPVKGKRLPPSEWLAHAQKVKSTEKVEGKPFTESELTYLKAIEDKILVAAEKELAAAEAQLQLLVLRAEAMKLAEEDDAAAADRPRVTSGEVEVDQDYAEQLEEQHEKNRESHGAKNTSTMTEKELSCKKWEANRDKEAREREQDKKARDARREEARDRKADAANAPDDA